MEALGILEVNQYNPDFLLVNFTDGTFATFSALELAELRPIRAFDQGECAEEGQDTL